MRRGAWRAGPAVGAHARRAGTCAARSLAAGRIGIVWDQPLIGLEGELVEHVRRAARVRDGACGG